MNGEPTVPPDLQSALAAAPTAEQTWHSLTPLSRRDYVGWINEAKKPETRQKRIKRCCESLLEGKRRPCCYAVVPMDLYRALGENAEAKTRWSALSGDQKRDFSGWIDDSEDKATRKARVEQALV